MSIRAEAYFLYGAAAANEGPATLKRETFSLPEPQAHEVLAAPLMGCWEGNMAHALERAPIDICRQRGEERVVMGNAGVVRVLRVGKDVTSLHPEQNALVFCVGEEDAFGFPNKILGYDAPGTMGVLATRALFRERSLIPLPDNSKYTVAQWAAFSLRYMTAWSNWNMAYGTFMQAFEPKEKPAINVWGWGGGVTLAELELAKLHGAKTVMLSGNDEHLEMIAASGITPLDRRKFGDMMYDPEKYRRDPAYRETYKKAETAFLAEVAKLTDGKMVQIFCDYIGTPVYRATLAALSRQGIITTAGWKEGMELTHMRAKECILRHQHINTHYARYPEGRRAVTYAEARGWMPKPTGRIYDFDAVPELAADYAAGKACYFPLFAINQ